MDASMFIFSAFLSSQMFSSQNPDERSSKVHKNIYLLMWVNKQCVHRKCFKAAALVAWDFAYQATGLCKLISSLYWQMLVGLFVGVASEEVLHILIKTDSLALQFIFY